MRYSLLLFSCAAFLVAGIGGASKAMTNGAADPGTAIEGASAAAGDRIGVSDATVSTTMSLSSPKLIVAQRERQSRRVREEARDIRSVPPQVLRALWPAFSEIARRQGHNATGDLVGLDEWPVWACPPGKDVFVTWVNDENGDPIIETIEYGCV
jgi:hypothetical protein